MLPNKWHGSPKARTARSIDASSSSMTCFLIESGRSVDHPDWRARHTPQVRNTKRVRTGEPKGSPNSNGLYCLVKFALTPMPPSIIGLL